MLKVIGQYNENGYNVDLINSHGVRITYYNAGNSPYDSQVYVSPEDGLSLETLKEFCAQTSQEIAKELNATFLGIEPIED